MATKTKAELEQENKLLREQIELLKSANALQPQAQPAAPMYVASPSTDVVVVYTSHCPGHMQGTQFSLDANVYGEEFTLSRQQFDELVGKYRHWFEMGILAVSYRNVDVAASKGLSTDKDIGVTVEELRRLGSMNTEEIEKLWAKAKSDQVRMSIVTYYKDRYLENAPGFRDRTRIDCLNRLTNGGFDVEAQTVGGRQLQLQPTDFLK